MSGIAKGTMALPDIASVMELQGSRIRENAAQMDPSEVAVLQSIAGFLSEIEARARKVIRREDTQHPDSGKLAGESPRVAGMAQSSLSHCRLVRECTIKGDIDGAVLAAIQAINHLWTAEGGDALTQNARNAGNARVRLDKDGKQAAKANAKELWLERRKGLHPKLKSDEQFARKVMQLFPVLTSSKVICGWCTAWAKEMKKTNKKPAN